MPKVKAPKPTWVRSAVMLRIIDGDTLSAQLDVGYYMAITLTLRLRGINAPEKNTAEGKKVLAYLKELLPVGSPITVETFHTPEDPHHRWIARVFKGELCVNDHLVEKKMAVPYMVDT